MRKTYSFDDVLLVPQYSDIKSRSEVDLACKLDNNITLELPIISSPMDTVTETKMAAAMADLGGLGIIHRYNTIEEQCLLAKAAGKAGGVIGAAIGTNEDFESRATALWDSGVRVLCLDVAHGHHVMVKNTLEALKSIFGEDMHLMAGNVATLKAFDDLASWGADSIRVGVGGGSICSTRLVTGHGIPTLQSIMDVSYTEHNAKIIADGGFKKTGDIVKALAAGADFVMLGSMLAGTDETPGEIFYTKNRPEWLHEGYKIYRGMASEDAQYDWRGRSSTPEGVSTTISCKGPLSGVMKNIAGGIRSGLSYTGARNIIDLQNHAEFVTQTQAGQGESSTHIMRRHK